MLVFSVGEECFNHLIIPQQPDLGTKRKEVGETGRKKWVKKI